MLAARDCAHARTRGSQRETQKPIKERKTEDGLKRNGLIVGEQCLGEYNGATKRYREDKNEIRNAHVTERRGREGESRGKGCYT